jgi:hypothetical protein
MKLKTIPNLNIKTMKKSAVLIISLFIINVGLFSQKKSSDKTGLKIYPGNPMYWQYNGQPVFLYGGSSNDNLFQNKHLIEELDLIKSIGGNFVRGNMSWRDKGNVKPYLKKNGLYDLDKPNPEYWNRFETFVRETEKRSIIIMLEIWPTVDFHKFNVQGWLDNPFNPAVNSNYTAKETNLPESFDHYHWEALNPIFDVVPGLSNYNPEVLKYLEQFVTKLLSITLKYNNVLYCMNNENYADPAWGQYWIKFIKEKAKKKGKVIYATDMFDDWDPTGGSIVPMNYVTKYDHPNLGRSNGLIQINHPEIYDYVDISNANSQFNEIHYAVAYWVYQKVKNSEHPRPIMVDKIYGGPNNARWCGDQQQGAEKLWRNLFAGIASARFHREPFGNGLSKYAQIHIKSMTMFLNKVDLFRMEPDPWFIAYKGGHEVYTLSDKEKGQYAVLFFDGGRPSVNLLGKVTFQWLDILENRWLEPQNVELTKGYEINPPGESFWLLLITKQ